MSARWPSKSSIDIFHQRVASALPWRIFFSSGASDVRRSQLPLFAGFSRTGAKSIALVTMPPEIVRLAIRYE